MSGLCVGMCVMEVGGGAFSNVLCHCLSRVFGWCVGIFVEHVLIVTDRDGERQKDRGGETRSESQG